MYIYINYICICATVNSILPTEIKKGHSGSPPKKVVLSSKARISVSVESLTFKRISLFQTEPDSACTKSPEGYWFVPGPGFCRLCRGS